MISNLVNELKVYCPECHKTMQRYLLAYHIRQQCGWVKVSCPDTNCRQQVYRKDQIFECPHESIECEYCAEKVAKLELDVHHSTLCSRAPTSDCLLCGAPVRSNALHRVECGMEVVDCAHLTYGCSWSGKRQDLATHATICIFSKLAPVLENLTTRIDTLRTENEYLKSNIPLSSNDIPHTSSISPPLPPNLSSETFDPILALRAELETVYSKIDQLETKHSVLFLNEMLRIREDQNAIRGALGTLRYQVQWLLGERRSSAMQRNASGSSNLQSTAPSNHTKATPVRRLSDSLRQDVKL